ncbi:MAG: hydrogenase/urease maturation nickel metallochaperone HypA [Methylocystis sp.]
MHEAHLMNDFISKIEQIAFQENAKKVISVKVWLGALTNMSSAHFLEHFMQSSAGTILEGAHIETVISQDLLDKNAQNILIDSLEVDL